MSYSERDFRPSVTNMSSLSVLLVFLRPPIEHPGRPPVGPAAFNLHLPATANSYWTERDQKFSMLVSHRIQGLRKRVLTCWSLTNMQHLCMFVISCWLEEEACLCPHIPFGNDLWILFMWLRRPATRLQGQRLDQRENRQVINPADSSVLQHQGDSARRKNKSAGVHGGTEVIVTGTSWTSTSSCFLTAFFWATANTRCSVWIRPGRKERPD